MTVGRAADETAFWSRVREELILRPAPAAQMTGLPGLAGRGDLDAVQLEAAIARCEAKH